MSILGSSKGLYKNFFSPTNSTLSLWRTQHHWPHRSYIKIRFAKFLAFKGFHNEEIMLIKGSFWSSKDNLLKYFGRHYCYKSKIMTQKENTASHKYQRLNLVLENDSPGIPTNFASSLQHLWNNSLSLYRCFFAWSASFVPVIIRVF